MREEKNLRNLYIYLPIILEVFYFLRFINPYSETLGVEDWDLNLFYLESTILPVRDYLQFPFWNHFYGSGYPILENPQSKLFSIAWILGLCFGSLHGIKISIYVYYLLGAIGAFYLFYSVLNFSYFTSFLVSNIIIFSGSLPLHLFAGHAMFLSVLLIPLGIAFFIKSKQTGEIFYSNISALIFSNLVFEGAIYYFTYSIFCYTILVILNPLELKLNWKINLSFWIILLFLSSHRLYPAWVYLNSTGASFFPDNSSLNLMELWKIFTISSQHPYVKNFTSQVYNWWEYGNYIGILPIFLFIVLSIFIKKKEIPLFILFIIVLLLMMGKFSEFAPASILSHLPIFSRQRCFGRWGMIEIIIFSIILGHNIESFKNWIQNKNLKFIVNIILISISIYISYDLVKFNSKPFKKIFLISQPKYPSMKKEKYPLTILSLPSYGGASSMYPAILNNLIIIDSYEMLFSEGKRNYIGDTDYKGEFFLDSGNEISEIQWSPNHIQFIIDSKIDDYLYMNSGYNPGWNSDYSKIQKTENGLMKIKIVPGKNDFTIHYYQNYYSWTLALYLISIIFIFVSVFLVLF